ncbi:MAG TPA: PEP/pyruvate-binding domain-containing protein, partial [Anaerolineales bacterium]
MSQSPPSNDQTAPLVAPFAQFGHTHIALAGGKGANLGELVRAGFDVPPGFIITTATYDLLLQSNGLHARLDGILAS